MIGQKFYSYLLKILICTTFFAPVLALSQDKTTCSNGPSLHLNENFDTITLVISAQNYDEITLSKIIVPVLSDEKNPQIIIFDRDGKTNSIYQSLNFNLKNKWLEYITVFQNAVVWSQDFFEAFNDKKGSAFIRLVNGYKKNDSHFKEYEKAQFNLQEKLKSLGISHQQQINIGDQQAKNGHKGGNIESTNEGFCLIGDADLTDSEWADLAKQSCGGPLNSIKLSTNWMPANHVDELIKQLPSLSKKTCNAKFAISSPQKTLDLLEVYPEDLFFDSGVQFFNTKMYDRSALGQICAMHLRERFKSYIWGNQLKPQANYEPIHPKEGYIEYRLPFANEKNTNIYSECFQIKNKDIVKLYRSDEKLQYSLEYAQKITNESKKIILNFYKNRRPDCDVSFIEIPTLFSIDTSRYYSEDRTFSVIVTKSEAILPNGINNLKVGKNIFIPNTGNKSVNEYMEKVYKTNGLIPTFLNTFDLHINQGNIHCSTQTIHTCEPPITTKIKNPHSEID
ncbi:MAG: hypothetical protein L6Q37_11890 [Bdellovibrionaceae bacterium]|nr:hypothetical protein [Pseudobdellovibrionaceae bacterium]